jgi:microcystin-dependent protein
MFVDPYLANVTIFAGNFAPRSWMYCQGQLLSISEYTALYSLIGTIYGGDGQVNFALPDLRGRCAIHPGQGQGLAPYTLGETGGNTEITLTSTQLPPHSHNLASAIKGAPSASTTPGTTDVPTGNVPAPINGSGSAYTTSPSAATMGTTVISTGTPPAGQSLPIDIMSPYLAMNYVICVEGIFPSRN